MQMHLQKIRADKMHPKRWWRENRTDCKLKQGQKYNRKPQNTIVACRVNEGHDLTVLYKDANLTQNARALTNHNSQPKDAQNKTPKWSQQ